MKKIEIINDSAYSAGKKHVQIIKDDEFKYPVIYGITEKDGVVFYYSSTKDKGHFGIPKLIMKSGAISTVLDLKGSFGMGEFATGIVDTPKNLIEIQKALETDEFKKLKTYFCGNAMSNSITDGQGYMIKFMKEFRKDFWKFL